MTGAKLRFETVRLHIAPWQNDRDRAEFRSELTQALTPAVLEYLPPSMAFDGKTEDIQAWIDERERKSDVFSIKEKTTGAFVGLFFVFVSEGEANSQIRHIGYLLSESYWGQGIASEALSAVVTHLPEQVLKAGVAKDNPASARVLMKAGFEIESQIPDGFYFVRKP